MAFVCTLVEGEMHVDAIRREFGAVANVLVGFDDETDDVYHLFVSMTAETGCHELSFFMVVSNEEEGREEAIASGLTVSRMIPKDARSLILEKLLTCAEALLNFLKPQCVYMCTVDADLPPQALAKFSMLFHVIRQSGYVGGKFDSYGGHHLWKMERVGRRGDGT